MKSYYKKKSYYEDLLLVLKGIAMGAANKVPGVSGGIVALVGGFYETLIYSFQHFNIKAGKLLFNKTLLCFTTKSKTKPKNIRIKAFSTSGEAPSKF